MKEIRPLTSLRAVAAFLVFMFHYADALSPANRGIDFAGEWIPLPFLWRQGDVGVSIFFVLSGFLITRIYYDSLRLRAVPLRRYFVKRVARIWPLFLVFAVIEHGAMLLRGEPATADWLVTMTMTQSFFSELVYQGLPVAWSLTVEECFYLIGPVAFGLVAWALRGADPQPHRLTWSVFLRAAGTLLVITVAVVGAGVVLVRVVQGAGWTWGGFMDSNFHMHHSTIFGRFPEFAIGMTAAFIHRGVDLEHLLRGRRATALTLAAAGIVAGCMGAKDALDHATVPMAQLATYAAAYGLAGGSALLILALSVEGGWVHRVMSWRLPVFLGKVSYGFYLIQLSVMMTPLMEFTDRLGWVRLPVLIVLTTVVCAFFFRVIEVPARRFIVGKWAN